VSLTNQIKKGEDTTLSVPNKMTKTELRQVIVKTHQDLKSNSNIMKSFLNENFEFVLTDKNIEELKTHFDVKMEGFLGYVSFKSLTKNQIK